MPPRKLTSTSRVNSSGEKRPVSAAVTANSKLTIEAASLNRLSPLRISICRSESRAWRPICVTATASVGASAAPKARAAAMLICGQKAWSVAPVAMMHRNTSPMASHRDCLSTRMSRGLDVLRAALNSSGAMNSTMNSSESSCTVGRNGVKYHMTPSATCTSGSETRGMKRSSMEETSTPVTTRMTSDRDCMRLLPWFSPRLFRLGWCGGDWRL